MTQSHFSHDGINDWHLDTAQPELSVIFPGMQRISEDTYPEAVELARATQAAHEEMGRDSFVMTYREYRYRVQWMRENRYALRKLRSYVPDLEEIGVPRMYRNLLLDPVLSREGGLVLIAGPTGAGKSTTAVATVGSRLRKYGGYCLTVEDPPEFPLEGFHGDSGYCEQLDVEHQKNYQQKLVDALRCFPSEGTSMLFFGEVRDPSAAAELCRIADGHLVIATIHANCISAAVQRALALASHDGENEAKILLSIGLKLVIYQQRERNILSMSALPTDVEVASVIRRGETQMLEGSADMWQRRLMMQRGK
jgi:twitching motility protein PilT